jgi:hypothetical protein
MAGHPRGGRSWYSDTAREVRLLPLDLGDHKVTPGSGNARWTVTSLKDSATVYNGIGPVEIRRAVALG